MDLQLLERTRQSFRERFDRDATVHAYAPGRIEVLGNHTDYNEGFVLSAAIDRGTYFLAAPAAGPDVCLVARDLEDEVVFPVAQPGRSKAGAWSNYVRGVCAKCLADPSPGFDAMIAGDLPLGAGLSSSAALEMSTGLALLDLYALPYDRIALARAGQAAEHEYAGAKCGLLDQVTSLFGRAGHLVMTDFRSLEIETMPLRANSRFLVCNTGVQHSLVESEYNARREDCEAAAAAFARVCDQSVAALRDVTPDDWRVHSSGMDERMARRAAHVIGENERVLVGRAMLQAGDLEGFGASLYASHASSQNNFENSCAELDTLVEAARSIAGIYGARLSGGGFGGSVIVLVDAAAVEAASVELRAAYAREYGVECEVVTVTAAAGAALLTPEGQPRTINGEQQNEVT